MTTTGAATAHSPTAHITAAATTTHRSRPDAAPPPEADAGQATTEYALVLLGAALVGLILITWATAGGTESRIGRLLDTVVDTITSRL